MESREELIISEIKKNPGIRFREVMKKINLSNGVVSYYVRKLEDNGIDTRAIMGGNLAKQPCMKNEKFEVHGDLKNANYITDNSFFIGSHPHINQEARQHVVDVFNKFFSEWELASL